MNVNVVLFALAKELLGQDTIEVTVPPACTVAELKQAIGSQFPDVAEIVSRSAISVDLEYAPDDMPLNLKSEIAIIPPVSGG